MVLKRERTPEWQAAVDEHGRVIATVRILPVNVASA
jgi:hypothetical protein